MIFTTLCANMRNERRRTARRQAATTRRVRKRKRRIENSIYSLCCTHSRSKYFPLLCFANVCEANRAWNRQSARFCSHQPQTLTANVNLHIALRLFKLPQNKYTTLLSIFVQAQRSKATDSRMVWLAVREISTQTLCGTHFVAFLGTSLAARHGSDLGLCENSIIDVEGRTGWFGTCKRTSALSSAKHRAPCTVRATRELAHKRHTERSNKT